MHAGVGVVGLDDVSEQKRRAAVGVTELERVVDPGAPLARERAQESGERQHEQERRRLLDGRQCGQEADGRERCVDRPRDGSCSR